MHSRLLAILLLGTATVTGQAPAALPARNQALLLLRVLAYDRNLRSRAGDELTVAVAFREGDPASTRERDELAAALEEAAHGFVVSGLRVRVRRVPWRGTDDLAARLATDRPAALLVGGALSGEAAAISAATRSRAVLSFGPSREMVEAGLALGLVNRGIRAGLVVNLAAAREEGADLDAGLLAVAEVVGKQ